MTFSGRSVLMCLIMLVIIQTSVSDSHSERELARQKRSVIGNLVDGLISSFSKTVADVLELDPDEFEDFVRALGRVGWSIATKIYNQFEEKTDAQFDFGSKQNFDRVDKMMAALMQDIARHNTTETPSGASAVYTTISMGLLAPMVNLLYSVICIFSSLGLYVRH